MALVKRRHRLPAMLLQCLYLELLLLERADRLHAGLGSGMVGGVGDFLCHGCGADLHFVLAGVVGGGGNLEMREFALVMLHRAHRNAPCLEENPVEL